MICLFFKLNILQISDIYYAINVIFSRRKCILYIGTLHAAQIILNLNCSHHIVLHYYIIQWMKSVVDILWHDIMIKLSPISLGHSRYYTTNRFATICNVAHNIGLLHNMVICRIVRIFENLISFSPWWMFPTKCVHSDS